MSQETSQEQIPVDSLPVEPPPRFPIMNVTTDGLTWALLTTYDTSDELTKHIIWKAFLCVHANKKFERDDSGSSAKFRLDNIKAITHEARYYAACMLFLSLFSIPDVDESEVSAVLSLREGESRTIYESEHAYLACTAYAILARHPSLDQRKLVALLLQISKYLSDRVEVEPNGFGRMVLKPVVFWQIRLNSSGNKTFHLDYFCEEILFMTAYIGMDVPYEESSDEWIFDRLSNPPTKILDNNVLAFPASNMAEPWKKRIAFQDIR